MICHRVYFRAAQPCRFEFPQLCWRLFNIVTMLGQSKRDLAALKTYKSAKTPRPDRYFFEPKFLQKTIRPVVFTERGTQISVFVGVLFPVGMRDEQPF